jgi:isopenicillin-N N-acyltransferase like protein
MTKLNPPFYQHIVAKGLPYDRGFTHGSLAKEKIKANIAHYKLPGKLIPLTECYEIIKTIYVPGIEKFFPSALEEMRGISDGAEVDYLDILLLNSRYDLARIKSKDGSHTAEDSNSANECTSCAVLGTETSNGDVLTGQNWDMSSHLLFQDLVVFLEIYPHESEGLPNMFVTTEAGQLARSGMNSAGLGVCANSLMSTEDFNPLSDRKPRLPMSLIRRQYLHQKLFGSALMGVFNTPRHVSNNLTVSTAEGFAMCLELTPTDMYRVYPKNRDIVVHGNHFETIEFASSKFKDRYPGPSSWYRVRRVEQELYQHKLLDQKTITTAFCDHLSRPLSVCQHPSDNDLSNTPKHAYSGSNATVAHVMYNLTRGTATVCKGPPCEGQLQTFSLGKSY